MSDVLRRTRPRSRGQVACSMCGARVPRGARYDRIEVPDAGTIVTTRVCDDCAECAHLCADDTDPAAWDDGVGADDIHDWALHSDHDAAARYLERRQHGEAVAP